MGSGASSLSDDEGAKYNRELYAPKPDPNAKVKSAGVFGRSKGTFTASKVASDDTTINDSYQHRGIDLNGQTSSSDIRLFNINDEGGGSNAAPSSTKLMTRLVYETIPDFLSYTVEDPSGTDLETANSARLMLVTPANYLEFYTTVYESLYDASTKHTFPIRTITFKNDFLSELMKMIVLEGESPTFYATQVAKFGAKYAKEGIDIVEYGMFGEAIILAMRKIKKGQRLDLWPRAYSRFVRALVPAMIIHTHSSPTPAHTTHTAHSPAGAASSQQEASPALGPAPGSTEQLQQAYALSRSIHKQKKVAFKSAGAGVSTSASVSGTVVSGVVEEGTVTGSTSDQ